MGMPELDEDHVIVCVHHLKAGMLKRIFRVSDTFQQIYDWVGSLYHYPEYFELSKLPGETVYPNESALKAENCILYMQERDDPISQEENDSVVGFKEQTPDLERLYEEIDASRENIFYSLNPTKKVLHLNRQDVFDELMKIYGKDRSILSHQVEVSLVDETAKGDGVGREVYSIFLEQLLQVAFDGREEWSCPSSERKSMRWSGRYYIIFLSTLPYFQYNFAKYYYIACL